MDHASSNISRLDERFLDKFSYVTATNAKVRLADIHGREREYVDLMSAYGAVNFGHNNNQIRDAATRQTADTVGRFYPKEAEYVADWLCQQLERGETGRVLFQIGGSHAVGAAIAIAQRARPGIILSVEGSFHGLGLESLAATSIHRSSAIQNTPLLERVTPLVRHLHPGDFPDDWAEVSCFLYEPVQGANGYIPLDPAWLAELEHQAVAAGVATIADEIQSGFYRHGTLSPARSMNLSPDIHIFSKSLTNGAFPLSAVVYDLALEPKQHQPFLCHTFQTAAMGYFWAKAVVDYIDSTPVASMGSELSAELQRYAEVLDGAGLVNEVHVTGPSLSFRPLRATAQEVVKRALSAGLLVFAGGASFQRIRVAPPLTVPSVDLQNGLAILRDCL